MVSMDKTLKIIIFLVPVVLFTVVSFEVHGQTVMVGTLVEARGWSFSSEERGSDSPSVITQEILRIIETGMMDTLFDIGFICFNLDPSIKNEPLNESHVSQMLFTAQSGGANRTLLFKGLAQLNQETTSVNQQVFVSGRLIYLDSQGREIVSAVLTDLTRSSALQQIQRIARQMLTSN
jgi:hypothetical protein